MHIRGGSNKKPEKHAVVRSRPKQYEEQDEQRKQCFKPYVETNQWMRGAELIRRCTISRDLDQGKHLHAQILSSPAHCHDRFIGNLLVDMYGKCGSIADARDTFDRINNRNVFSWNSLVTAFAQNGHFDRCKEAFVKMPQWDSVSWSIYFGGFSLLHSTLESKRVFDSMPEQSSRSWVLIIQAYARAGDFLESLVLFDAMPRKNPVSWTCIVSILADAGEIDQANRAFHLMPQHSVISCTVVLSALGDPIASSGSLGDAKLAFDRMPERTCLTWTSLLQGFSRRSIAHIEDCKALFWRMPRHDTASATAMASALARSGRFHLAEELLIAMPARDLVSWSALVSIYGRDGRIEAARRAYEKMPQHDIVSWTTMIESYLQNPGHGDHKDLAAMIDQSSTIIFHKARRDPLASSVMIAALAECDRLSEATEFFLVSSPRDATNWAAMVVAFAGSELDREAIFTFSRMPKHDQVAWNTIMARDGERPGELDRVKAMFDRMPCRNVVSWNVMIHASGRDDLRRAWSGFFRIPQWDLCSWTGIVVATAGAGEIFAAREIFEQMPRQDLVSWNAVIAAYVRGGELDLAREIFTRMKLEGNRSSASTYTAILAGCCYRGLMEEGRRFFLAMAGDDWIQPGLDHYCCMIELLGHGKKLEEAEEIIETMPIVAPSVAWMTLLAACKIHGDAKRAARAMGKIAELDPGLAAPYSLYAAI